MHEILVTDATTLPVSVESIKAHSVVDVDTEDERLESYIQAATKYVATYTGLALQPKTYDVYLGRFPSQEIVLPNPPLNQITHVKYYADGVLETLDPGDYIAIKPSDNQGEIWPVDCWPVTDCRPDAVQIRYTCGYTVCPPDLQHAIKLLVGAWNELREAEIPGSTSMIQVGLDRLLAISKVWRYR